MTKVLPGDPMRPSRIAHLRRREARLTLEPRQDVRFDRCSVAWQLRSGRRTQAVMIARFVDDRTILRDRA
jgi:hypothetical protein